MGRRVLSLLLAIVMMIGMFPVNVLAEQDNDTGSIGQEIVESTTEPAVQSDENANGEKNDRRRAGGAFPYPSCGIFHYSIYHGRGKDCHYGSTGNRDECL